MKETQVDLVKLDTDEEIDHELWSTNSDLEHLRQIQERANLGSPLEDFPETRHHGAAGFIQAGYSGQSSPRKSLVMMMGAHGEAAATNSTKDKTKNQLAQEAVMKLVDNIDSNAVSA